MCGRWLVLTAFLLSMNPPTNSYAETVSQGTGGKRPTTKQEIKSEERTGKEWPLAVAKCAGMPSTRVAA